MQCKLLLSLAITSVFLLLTSSSAQAGCGCNKPPPAPAAVIPHVAFGRMKISLFDARFQPGQQWTVVFRNGLQESRPRKVKVKARRALTDTTGQTTTPTLLVTVPATIPVGPTSITASNGVETLTIPDTDFTVIGKPVMVSEKIAKFTKANYTTAVGADGTLYFSLGGLAKVCQPMKFNALMEGNPLRFGDTGSIVIFNSQGFLIESLACTPAGCTPASHYFPDLNTGDVEKSDKMEYWRHSFARYCVDHRPGGAKAIDPHDQNWHQDGTPHVDYSTLIFAVTGHYDDGSTPLSGAQIFDLEVESKPDDLQEGWETEKEEEDIDHH